ncbi:hypothetical protein ACFL38_05555, partial [Candidatus Omnitrophota bacterium]
DVVNRLDNNWSLGGILEFDLFIGGEQKSYLSQADLGYNDLSNTQHRGYGARGSIRVEKNTDLLDLIIEPFIKYWNISDSDVEALTYRGAIIGGGLEPENNSFEYGLKCGVRF